MTFLRKAFLVNSTEFVCLCLGIIQASFLARTLGPAGVGQYDLICSVLILASQLCCLGFPQSFLYHSKIEPEKTQAYLVNSILSMTFLGIIAGITLVLLVIFKRNYFGFLPWFALLGIGLYVPILLGKILARNVLLIHIEAIKLSLMRLLSMVGGLSLLLVFYIFGILEVPQAVLGFVFVVFIAAIVGWLPARRYLDFSVKPGWAISLRLASMGIKLSLADIMILVNGQINILLIKYLLGNFENVGYFSRAQRISMLMLIACQAVFPLLFSRWASINAGKLQAHVEKVLRYATTLAAIIIIGILLTAKWIILVLYGSQFLSALEPMVILIPGAVLYMISRILMQLIGSQGRPELSAVSLAIAAATNALFCWFLIPGNGIIGAAWASTSGNTVLLFLMMLIVKKKYDIRIRQSVCLRKKDVKDLFRQLIRTKSQS